MGEHSKQYRNVDVCVASTHGPSLTFVPIPSLPDPDVSRDLVNACASQNPCF